MHRRKALKKAKQVERKASEKIESEKLAVVIASGTEPDDVLETQDPKNAAIELTSDTNDNLIEVKKEDATTEKVCGEELGAINENDEGFIGPKLPRMMTQEEIDVFKEELLAKYKLW